MDFDNIHESNSRVEEVAEEFVLGRLAPDHRLTYEKHLLTCPTCESAVERVLEFVKLLRKANESELSE